MVKPIRESARLDWGGAHMRESKGVLLTREDWNEIYYAIDTKITAIENGDYGGEDHQSSPNGCLPDCEACENERWVKHLQEIQEKIGNDGENAIECGVAPYSKRLERNKQRG